MRYGGWLRPMDGVAERPVWLVCCPHAGGTADFYRDWPGRFPPRVGVVAVQYPGHGDRLDEPCRTDVHQLAAELAHEIECRCLARPVLFGHSFGAAVAFETAARLSRRGVAPHAVLVSAHVAPHREPAGPVVLRDTVAIWDEMIRLGGTPPEVATDPEWRELLTPSLRADFHANDTYRPSRCRLPCPITALTGSDDDDVAYESIVDWREYTESDFAVRVLGGAHFYLTEHVGDIAAEVARLTSLPVLGTAHD